MAAAPSPLPSPGPPSARRSALMAGAGSPGTFGYLAFAAAALLVLHSASTVTQQLQPPQQAQPRGALAADDSAAASLAGGGGDHRALLDTELAIDVDHVHRDWHRLASHPEGVAESHGLWHRGELWTIGGFPATRSHRNVWRYQPGRNRWVQGPRLPGYDLHHTFTACFSVGGGDSGGGGPPRIVTIGGIKGGRHADQPVRTHQFINVLETPGDDETRWRWRHVAPPPGFNTSGVATCSPLDEASGDAYCLIGSLGGFGVEDEYRHYRFRPASLELEALPLPPPVARVNHVTLFLDRPRRRVIAMPGRSDSDDYNMTSGVYAYDIRKREWGHMGDVPPTVVAAEARGTWQHPTQNWGLLLGGQDGHDYTSTAVIYRVDFSSGTHVAWEAFSQLPSPTFSHVVLDAAAVPPGAPPPPQGRLQLYVVGGAAAPGIGGYSSGDVFLWTLPAGPDAALQSSAMLLPRLHRAQEGTGGAAVGLRPGQLRVLSALYGPHDVRAPVQALIDAGVRVVHMGGGAPFADITVLPELPSLAVPGRERGRFSLGVTLLETPLQGSAYVRVVACATTGACRLF